jgi:hypothetical protein
LASTSTPTVESPATRLEVPMPPFQPKHTIPVPGPRRTLLHGAAVGVIKVNVMPGRPNLSIGPLVPE